MLHSKYLIQDDILSNIMNGIKEILQPSSSITLPEAITLLSASEQHLQLNMPYYIGYDDNVWPTQSVNDKISNTETIVKNSPLLFFDIQSEHANELGQNLREVHLDSVPYIPTSAFRSCSNLKYVSINTSGATGNEAFMDCYNLQEIYLSTASIGSTTFINCSNLSNVNLTFSNCQSNNINIDSSWFYNCSNLINIIFNLEDNVNFTIKMSAFQSCPTLKSININISNVNYVNLSAYAFYNCYNLEYFNFERVSQMISCNYAFAHTNLKEINAPILQTINGYATFYKCDNLSIINVPNLTQEIYAIISCSNLTTLYAPLLSEKLDIRNCPKLSNIILSSNFNLRSAHFISCGISDILSFSHNTSIGYSCFRGCINISQAIFPYATSVGFEAFEDCTGLEEVSFPELQILHSATFSGCTKLKSIILPKLISFTGSYSGFYTQFTNCTALEEASFPIYTGIMPQGIFQNCNNLKTLTVSSITEIGYNAFFNCQNLSQINGNISCSKVFRYTFYNCYSLNSIDIQPTEIEYSAFFKCYNLSTVDLTSCSIIGSYAFYACHNLSSIDLTNCSIIGSYAFDFCSALTYISTSAIIDIGAFMNCTNLKEIHICSNSLSKNIFFSNYAVEILDLPELLEFSMLDCSEMSILSSLNLPKCTSIYGNLIPTFSTSKLKNLSLPKCTYIGDRVFENCIALENLNISAATLIKPRAFGNCTNLRTIYVNSSTVTQVSSYGVIISTVYLPPVSLLSNLEKIVAGSLVSEYKNDSYWSQYADYIVSQ